MSIDNIYHKPPETGTVTNNTAGSPLLPICAYHTNDYKELQAKLASAIEVLRHYADQSGEKVWGHSRYSLGIADTYRPARNGYDKARKWLEENVEATQDDSNGREIQG